MRTGAESTFIKVFDAELNESFLSLETGETCGWFYEIENTPVVETPSGRTWIKAYNEENLETLLCINTGEIQDWFSYVDEYSLLETGDGQVFLTVRNEGLKMGLLSVESGAVFGWYNYIDAEVTLESAGGGTYVQVFDEDDRLALLRLNTGELLKTDRTGYGNYRWQMIQDQPCSLAGNNQGQWAFLSISTNEPLTDWHYRIHEKTTVVDGKKHLVAENSRGEFALISIDTGKTVTDWNKAFISNAATRDLMFAIGEQNDSLIRKILQSGIDLNSDIVFVDTHENNIYAAKPLYMLIADVEYADPGEKEWLLDLFRLFVDAGADVNAPIVGPELGGFTPLTAAFMLESPDLVEFLISRDADVNNRLDMVIDDQPIQMPLLLIPITMEDAAMTRLLIDAGADLNTHFTFAEYGVVMETTPLHVAYDIGNREILRLLVENGADVNWRDHEGRTLLEKAREDGEREVMEILNQRPR